jgi:Na+-transporting NADH:ubiquinone oxidoreductase subunit A
MPQVYNVRKGLNINLAGKAEKFFGKVNTATSFAVKPTDFQGVVPNLEVREGSLVKAGTTLFTDKNNPVVRFTSPVSGQVKAINRGERRIITEVVVEPDNKITYEVFKVGNPLSMSAKEIKDNLLMSGLWPAVRQRPYHIIANPEDTPKSIFVSAFDTAPLAPDYDFVILGSESDFQMGIDALSMLTPGKVHVNISSEYPASHAYTHVKNAQTNYFRGPHPAGNVGVQIQRIDPLNKGEVIWFVTPQDVVSIGRLFKKGVYDASKLVELTGSEAKNPRYYRVIGGVCVSSLSEGNIKNNTVRFISGNPLTGKQILPDGYLGFYDSQITVIPEGDHYEFLGWALPGFAKYSFSRTYWSWLAGDHLYSIDTNIHGGNRPFVITGLYEKVFPMNIYPMQLLKAIIAEDIDQMERLGIYEIAEEDFALCEFVCPSKTEIQALVRKGLDLMKKEMSLTD